MWIHGGALIMGSRKGLDVRFCAELLKRNFAIVSIDYRLAPETKLPGIIEDVQDAWRWVRQEGPKRFGIDPDRIATAGGSAGGYLTLMTGFCLGPRPRVPGFLLRLRRYHHPLVLQARRVLSPPAVGAERRSVSERGQGRAVRAAHTEPTRAVLPILSPTGHLAQRSCRTRPAHGAQLVRPVSPHSQRDSQVPPRS